ncbi:hypothetical protein E2553_00550 [Paraburkholderia dipogonis]|uniref:Uncharacterized protein n=1 Tax=Paraburkholderia dipogonis TaxID=1211383 RepID=A0A4Y8N1V2_9BURK|nr:hypothetical protein [Paraburkholderia dipogonis]TFE43652.1 hypothetical protein E2553_00550 [Paraburkholderia dipogonis]
MSIKVCLDKSIGTNKAASVPYMRQPGAEPHCARVCGEWTHRTACSPEIFNPDFAPNMCIRLIGNGQHLYFGALNEICTIFAHSVHRDARPFSAARAMRAVHAAR